MVRRVARGAFGTGDLAVGRAPARRIAALRRYARPERDVAIRADLRLRLVSASRQRLASVLRRHMDVRAFVRMDVDWRPPLGVSDAPLRTLGLREQPLVLDSWPCVRAGVGRVGLRGRLRELVSARYRQPSGLR